MRRPPERSAHWLARYCDGELRRQPAHIDMHAEIAHTLGWKRRGRGVTATYGGPCIAPYHHFHFDELMTEIDAQTKSGNVFATHLAPISPRNYAGLLATAPGHARQRVARTRRVAL